jgi:ornithine decarboxylase
MTQTAHVYKKHADCTIQSAPEISLDLATVKKVLAEQGYDRATLIVDSQLIRQKTRRFCNALPKVRPHFAVKSNPEKAVLQTLIEEGAGFEIASIAELDILLELNVPAQEIFYSNPIKHREYISYAKEKGVQWFVVDSEEEISKIYSIHPHAKMYLRIDAPNVGSDWPLSGKFGAPMADAERIINHAAMIGADLAGATFHVGSQCRNPENWKVGLERMRICFDLMLAKGLNPRLINIGGGYPVQHVKNIPTIEEIAAVVNEGLKAFPEDIQIIAEPGRFLVSDAGYYVCRIIGTATRNQKRWMFWDAGVFGGVIETTEGLRYQIDTDKSGELISWNVAGPTCDAVDVPMRDEMMPCDLAEGDFVYIKNAGVYTTAYASNFNGFPLPRVIIL